MEEEHQEFQQELDERQQTTARRSIVTKTNTQETAYYARNIEKRKPEQSPAMVEQSSATEDEEEPSPALGAFIAALSGKYQDLDLQDHQVTTMAKAANRQFRKTKAERAEAEARRKEREAKELERDRKLQMNEMPDLTDDSSSEEESEDEQETSKKIPTFKEPQNLIAHLQQYKIQQLPEDISHETDAENKFSASYKKFLPIRLNNINFSALIDSGNTWHSVISESVMTKLGFTKGQLSAVKDKTVQLADNNSQIKTLGQIPRTLKLKVPGVETAFKFKPIVVKDLAMDINISGPFMAAHKWVHDYGNAQLIAQGRKIPLLATMGPPVCSQVYTTEDTVVEPWAFKFIDALVPDVKAEVRPINSEEVILEGGRYIMEKHDISPGINVLTNVNQKGHMKVPLINTRNQPIKIPKGTLYGHISPVAVNKAGNHRSEINCIYSMRSDSDSFQPPQKRKKIETKQMTMTKEEKMEWLNNKFNLKNNKFLKNKRDYHMAMEVLLQFFDLFSLDGSYGHTDLIEHRIITEDVLPIKDKMRHCNPALEDSLKQQLEKWLEEEVIEPAYSPWAANMVPVKKKNGDIRWCIDYRRLNKVTKKDTFPMPTVNNTIAKVAGSEIFSSLDMQGAFHVISINQADREKTAFVTPFGVFQQTKLGFGLCNGPASYARLVELVLQGIPSSIAIGFLDDGIVHSKDAKTHIKNLATTFKAYAKAGLKLNPAKCKLFQEEVLYLGHTLNKYGIRPPQEYKDAVAKWPIPTTKHEAKSFLGLVNYYRNHVPDFAKFASSWNVASGGGYKEKTDKHKPLQVTPEMKKDFEELRKRLVEAPILGFPYFRGQKQGRFTLDTDFSGTQIAGILSQEQDGKEVVIAYGSKKLDKTQQNYASTKGELFAGQYWMQKYGYYLKFGPEFTWRTDNSALKYLETMDSPPATIQRWREIMADFNFKVEHRAGKLHCNADALSRYGFAQPPDKDEEEEEHGGTASDQQQIRKKLSREVTKLKQPTVIATVQKDTALTNGNTSLPLGKQQQALRGLINLDLRNEQKLDHNLNEVYDWVKHNQEPSREERLGMTKWLRNFALIFSRLSIDKESKILCYTTAGDHQEMPKTVPIVPEHLYHIVIKANHLALNHMAADKTVQAIADKAWFPAMDRETRSWIDTCLPCQAKSHRHPAQKHTLKSPLTGFPWQKVHLDFVGPLPRSRKGHQWILTMRDHFSKWPEAVPMARPTADNVVKALESHLFTRFGIPTSIHSDCGAQFTSNLFREVSNKLGINISTTTPYHPQSNGIVERMHRDLGNMLRSNNLTGEADWETMLDYALYAMRIAKSKTTGLSPYQILFGTEINQPIDLIFRLPKEEEEALNDHTVAGEKAMALRKRIQRAHEFVRRNMRSAVERQRKYYFQDKKLFIPGTKVWLYTPRTKPGQPRKLATFWSGPWIVVTPILNELVVRIQPQPHWKIDNSIVVSIDRLKIYKSGDEIEPQPGDDLGMLGDEYCGYIPPDSEDDDSGDEGYFRPHGGDGGQGPPPDPPAPPQGLPEPEQNDEDVPMEEPEPPNRGDNRPPGGGPGGPGGGPGAPGGGPDAPGGGPGDDPMEDLQNPENQDPMDIDIVPEQDIHGFRDDRHPGTDKDDTMSESSQSTVRPASSRSGPSSSSSSSDDDDGHDGQGGAAAGHPQRHQMERLAPGGPASTATNVTTRHGRQVQPPARLDLQMKSGDDPFQPPGGGEISRRPEDSDVSMTTSTRPSDSPFSARDTDEESMPPPDFDSRQMLRYRKLHDKRRREKAVHMGPSKNLTEQEWQDYRKLLKEGEKGRMEKMRLENNQAREEMENMKEAAETAKRYFEDAMRDQQLLNQELQSNLNAARSQKEEERKHLQADYNRRLLILDDAFKFALQKAQEQTQKVMENKDLLAKVKQQYIDLTQVVGPHDKTLREHKLAIEKLTKEMQNKEEIFQHQRQRDLEIIQSQQRRNAELAGLNIRLLSKREIKYDKKGAFAKILENQQRMYDLAKSNKRRKLGMKDPNQSTNAEMVEELKHLLAPVPLKRVPSDASLDSHSSTMPLPKHKIVDTSAMTKAQNYASRKEDRIKIRDILKNFEDLDSSSDSSGGGNVADIDQEVSELTSAATSPNTSMEMEGAAALPSFDASMISEKEIDRSQQERYDDRLARLLQEQEDMQAKVQAKRSSDQGQERESDHEQLGARPRPVPRTRLPASSRHQREGSVESRTYTDTESEVEEPSPLEPLPEAEEPRTEDEDAFYDTL